MKKGAISLYTILGLFILMVLGRIWKQDPHPISWDVGGYYLYLPATFIYHDLGMKNYDTFDSLRTKYEVSNTFYQAHQSPKGKWVIKYTMGSALLYAPFFIIGHCVAKITGKSADGYSTPYQMSLIWGTLLYAALALWYARKILLYFFTDQVAALSLMGIVMGTNLFLFLSMDNLQIHYNLFLLYTIFIWSTLQFHERPSYKRVALMGVLAGLIVLTRPTDIVSWAIPIFWGVTSFKTFKDKIISQFKYFVIFFIIAAIVFLPQILYWKWYAGSWLYNSYNNPGEGLDLFSPHTISFLFSYRKGWLIYTPLAIFALGGIFISLKKNSKIFLSFFIFMVFNIWVVSSWTCWWYAGSFSSRAMVQSYAVLLIPFGYFIQYLATHKGFFSSAVKGMVLLMVFLSIFQTWQYASGILKSDRMTKAYYWKVFGTTSYNAKYEKYLLREKFLETDTIPNPQNYLVRNEFVLDWKDSSQTKSDIASKLVRQEKGYCLKLDSGSNFFTVLEEELNRLTDKYFACIRVEGDIRNSESYSNNPVELVRTMIHKGELYFYSSSAIFKDTPPEPNAWHPFKIDYILPDARKKNDRFKAYFWLRGNKPVFIQNIRVKVLEPKDFPELE